MNKSDRKQIHWLLTVFISLFVLSCGNKEDTAPKEKPLIPIKVDTSKVVPGSTVKKPPIINIVDTIIPKQIILYMKDSASSSERISRKLDDLYKIKMPDLAKKHSFKIIGPPIAWYRSQQAPFFFEAGMAIDKKPTGKLPRNFYVKNIGGDSAVIAHFFGPYEITIMGYEALNEWLKIHKKKKTKPSYEVYVGDPYDKSGKRLDPYKVRTDIVFPHN